MSDQKFEASWPTMPPTLEEAVVRPHWWVEGPAVFRN
jgi:hypothetical protein